MAGSPSHTPTAGPLKKVSFVVIEIPKMNLALILRDIMELHQMGCDVRISHLNRFSYKDILNKFAALAMGWAQGDDYALP